MINKIYSDDTNRRPNGFWDLWYLGMAKYVSTGSKDPSTQAGAVLIRPNRTVISVGYNGFPKGMSDSASLYANREEKYSRVVHAEVNALIHANDTLYSSTLYTYPFSCCDRCVVQMIQAGVKRFVFPVPSEDALSRWADSFKRTKEYIRDACCYFTELKEPA